MALLLALTAAAATAQTSGPGQLDASESLFNVLAAINAAGYDAELQSPTNHPLRAQVRQAIAAAKPPSLTKLKEFFAARRTGSATADLSQYISFALSVDGPPTFKPRYSAAQMPPDTLALAGFSELLATFHHEAGLADLWRQAQPAIDRLVEQYHGPVSQAILDSNIYLRFPTSGAGGRRFQVYLDVLGAPNQVHTRSLADDYFVVITPSVQPRIRDVRHAYLHYLLDPLAIRYAANLDSKKDVFDLAHGAPLLAEEYKNDPGLLAGMCMVKAVEARMDRSSGPAHVDQAMKEGFILTAYFYEALAGYEKQEQAFRLYVAELFKNIDPVKEDKRIAQVQFATQRTDRVVRPQAPQPAAPSPSAQQLERAETLYKQRQFEAANQEFRAVIQSQAPKPDQAKAYYGLARIALQQNNPDLALELFRKILESEPEPFERAWAHVYLARLAMAASDPDPETARKQYQAALSVEGASEGARKAAEVEMARLAAKQ